jgi:Ca-activated chloride channel homolog
MNKQASTLVTLGASALLVLAGCGDSAEGDSASGGPVDGPPGATGVTQGGAQDFGLFRQILEDGGVPGPETIDDIGFFAEHKLDYPAPDCGDDLCIHGLLGANGNLIEGSPATVIQIGMNTPVDASELARPPMHLVLSVDTSGSMQGGPIEYLRAGLVEMIDELHPDDHVSLVSYSSEAHVVLEYVPASERELLEQAFLALQAVGSTNLYDGLFTAYQLTEAHHLPTDQDRVIFLSDGVATTGLPGAARLRSLAEAYARRGVALSSIGVGTDFDLEVMKQLGEVGAGNFYFLEDPSAVVEVFTEEVRTFLYPLALDAKIEAELASAYLLRASYGTTGWRSYGSGGAVSIPSLFLASRQSSSQPAPGGRRGGGGALLIEVVPRPGISANEPPAVGSVSVEWTDPRSGDRLSQSVDVTAPFAPGAVPEEGYFTDATVEKGFVMLNLYVAFESAAQLAADSDPRTARRALEAIRPNVAAWLAEHDDADIEDDLRYVDLFIQNLGPVADASAPYTPADPPNPWPYY